MVNAQKHKALLNDIDTRLTKKLMKHHLLSKNSQKNERLENQLLYSRGGETGKRSIVEANLKRDKAKRGFINIFTK